MHNGELHNLYSSPDIIKQIKSTTMRQARHTACTSGKRNVYTVLVEKTKGKNHLEDQGACGKMGTKGTLGR
jgi:hypothetical protein